MTPTAFPAKRSLIYFSECRCRALSVGAPDSLGRQSVKFHEGATHPFRIVEPHGSRDLFDRLGPVLQAHTGRFDPKPLDGLGRGFACLSLECAPELPDA
jgi:hypothetical protein